MNENIFVAVGRIERIMTGARGLTLVIGGTGPVKGLVAVQLRDAGLIKVVTNQGSGFTPGDVISVGGQLEYDSETHQNVAIAAPDRVSRVARAASAAIAQLPSPAGAKLFGRCDRTGSPAGSGHAPSAPPPDLGSPHHYHGELVGLRDIAL